MKVSYWTFFLTFLFGVMVSSTLSQAAVINGKVSSVQGEFIELDVGSDKGLNVGDAGRVYYTVTVGGEMKPIYVAKFRVTFISDKASMAKIEDKTGELRVGNLIEIEVKLGELEIKSEPTGARIYIDGKETGETPSVLRDVRPGHHLIKVVKEGYETYEEYVEVRGTGQKSVHASLKSMTGELVIRTDPLEATISIDGKYVGTSRYEKKDFSLGAYKIRVNKEGYEAWERDVIVEAGKKTEVLTQLKQKVPEGKLGDAWQESSTGIEFVWIPGGCFEMGCIGSGFRKKDCRSADELTHQVCLEGFWMCKYEITQEQYQKLMGSNPSQFQGGDLPVETVSWEDVQEFIRRLNKMTAINFRLPTEAEWEYAARSGGKKEKYSGTSDESLLENYAWYYKNSGGRTHPVGQKKPNEIGLYDMTGNVSEWINDWYDNPYYRYSPRNNPNGPQNGVTKVIRGGSWYFIPYKASVTILLGGPEYLRLSLLRTSSRNSSDPSGKDFTTGFRLVLPAK